jgi:Lon protease-like protein
MTGEALSAWVERYRSAGDLPPAIAAFPLRRTILLPRAVLPLSVFEPRYLEMLDDVMSSTRLLLIVQPVSGESESPPGKSAALRRVGCVGRVTGYQELDDGHLAISLTGVARCTLQSEVPAPKPYRQFAVGFDRFAGDFTTGSGEADVDRNGLITVLKAYLEARQLKADWASIAKAPSEWLVNSLAMVAPYGPEEKQALLEAPDLKSRAAVLVALAEMELAVGVDGSRPKLQ